MDPQPDIDKSDPEFSLPDSYHFLVISEHADNLETLPMVMDKR